MRKKVKGVRYTVKGREREGDVRPTGKSEMREEGVRYSVGRR